LNNEKNSFNFLVYFYALFGQWRVVGW